MVDIKILNKIKSDIYAENYVAVKNNIHNLLKNCHKLEYENLALKLLNVDVYKQDAANSRTIVFLKQLDNNNLLKNLYKHYLIKFHNCLNYQNNLYAKINLEVIEELEKLGTFKEEIYLPADLQNYLSQKDNYDYLKTIMAQLKTEECYLSGVLEDTKLKAIQNMAMDYSNLETSIIRTDIGKRLLFRNVSLKEFNENEVALKAKEALKTNNFKEALKNYQKLVQKNGTVLNYIYANLGLIYLKLHSNESALKYLTIASYKKGSKHYDFKNIIDNLQSLVTNSITPLVHLEEFTKVNDYLLKYQKIIMEFNESKNNLENICEKYNLTRKEFLIIKILIARYYYANHFNEYGDKLIKETRINKAFYPNQEQYQKIMKLKV